MWCGQIPEYNKASADTRKYRSKLWQRYFRNRIRIETVQWGMIYGCTEGMNFRCNYVLRTLSAFSLVTCLLFRILIVFHSGWQNKMNSWFLLKRRIMDCDMRKKITTISNLLTLEGSSEPKNNMNFVKDLRVKGKGIYRM